ncbi:MAG: SlyX family protein [Planctomycetota bacterium]
MADDRLTQLEELLAHQQRLLDELNGVLTELRTDVDALTREQAKLRATVARLVQLHDGADDTPGEKPPHY